MKVQIQKWGNSLALRIPKSFAVETDIRQGSTVEVTLEKDRIIMRPAKKETSLDDLLSRITDENRHDEADFGKPEGKEIW